MEMEIGGENTITSEKMAAFFRRHPNWIWGGAGLLTVVAFLLTLYMLGTFGNGYESKRISFENFSSSDRGYSLGTKTCYLKAGQVLIVHYEAEVVRGGLTLLVDDYKEFIGGDPINRITINQTGTGDFRTRAPEDGFYKLRTYGSPDGNGYEVTYTLRWWEE